MRPTALLSITAFIAVVAVPQLVVAEPTTLTGKVVSVHDADTLTGVDADKVQHKVRLLGIDAPETKQAFGTKSLDRLTDLTLRKTVVVNVHGHDRYGRVLGSIEAAGQDVNKRMVCRRAGVALRGVQQGCRAGPSRA